MWLIFSYIIIFGILAFLIHKEVTTNRIDVYDGMYWEDRTLENKMGTFVFWCFLSTLMGPFSSIFARDRADHWLH